MARTLLVCNPGKESQDAKRHTYSDAIRDENENEKHDCEGHAANIGCENRFCVDPPYERAGGMWGDKPPCVASVVCDMGRVRDMSVCTLIWLTGAAIQTAIIKQK